MNLEGRVRTTCARVEICKIRRSLRVREINTSVVRVRTVPLCAPALPLDQKLASAVCVYFHVQNALNLVDVWPL